MRRVFDRISDRIRGFLKQRDHAALVLRCREGDCIAVLKILEEMDESSTSEWFWNFTQDFLDAPGYVSGIVKDFALQHESICRAMELQKKEPWPPIPPVILDESLPPAPRLRELMVFSRSLLGRREGSLAVWVLCPLHIADPAAHAGLMGELLEHQNPFPWFHHIRILAREDDAAPSLSHALAETARVDFYTPDLSEETMDRALEEDAADQALPLAERVQAMFLSAQRDYSYGRFDEALRKHEVVLNFHSAIGNTAMVALTLNSVGEIHQRLGRSQQAERCFEAALEPACEGLHPPVPVLYNTLVKLAEVRLSQTRFAEAEVFYDGAEKLATLQRDPRAKLEAIEKVGDCQSMQGKEAEAVQSWRHGAEIAGKLEVPELQRSMLVRLRQHFGATDQWIEQQEVEQQLASLGMG
jgi:tetratricopeptide (TPR) repeat protein